MKDDIVMIFRFVYFDES